MADNYRFLTLPAAARRLGETPDRVLRLISDGRLRAVNVGNRAAPAWRLDPADVRAFQSRRDAETRLVRRRRSRTATPIAGV